MKNVFKVTPSVAFFATPRSGSTALVGAILEKYNPTLKAMADNAHAPEGRRGMPHSVAPVLQEYSGQTIVLPVRDPVERFRSAFAIKHWLRDYTGNETVDEVITIIEAQDRKKVNPHFRLQKVFLERLKTEADEIQIFQFPRDLSEMSTALMLDAVPEPDHVSKTKPDLTPEQLSRVQAIYADDIALYDSIIEAGQVWTKPPTPATKEDKAAKLQELASARYDAEVGGMDFNGVQIQTDRFTQSKISSAYAKAKEDNTLTLNWKTGSGWVTLDAAAIIDIADALFAFIQSVYSQEKSLSEQVEAAAFVEELQSIAWIPEEI